MSLLSRSGYDDDHESFRGSARRFFVAEVAPRLDDWRSSGRFARDLGVAAGEQGFLGTAVPEQFGGGGVDDPRFVAVLVEEAMAVGAAGLALVLARHAGACVPAVLRLPDSVQRSSWLSGLATGDLLAVPVVLGPTLEAAGVPGAAAADLFVVTVPGPDQAIAVLPEDKLQVLRVSGPLGGREAAVADVRVDEAALTAAPTVHDDGSLQRDLDLWAAVVAVAGARAALDLTLTYVRERKVFGRPVAEFENTRFRLAELGAEIAACQTFVDSCVEALAAGTLVGATAAAAQLTSGLVHDRAVDQGMQLHGGYGYMREYPISHAFSDARFLRLTAAATRDPRQILATALGL